MGRRCREVKSETHPVPEDVRVKVLRMSHPIRIISHFHTQSSKIRNRPDEYAVTVARCEVFDDVCRRGKEIDRGGKLRL